MIGNEYLDISKKLRSVIAIANPFEKFFINILPRTTTKLISSPQNLVLSSQKMAALLFFESQVFVAIIRFTTDLGNAEPLYCRKEPRQYNFYALL